jgi:preprotein translocase subunit Sec63
VVDLLYFEVIGVEKSASHADMRRMLIYHVTFKFNPNKFYMTGEVTKVMFIVVKVTKGGLTGL